MSNLNTCISSYKDVKRKASGLIRENPYKTFWIFQTV